MASYLFSFLFILIIVIILILIIAATTTTTTDNISNVYKSLLAQLNHILFILMSLVRSMMYEDNQQRLYYELYKLKSSILEGMNITLCLSYQSFTQLLLGRVVHFAHCKKKKVFNMTLCYIYFNNISVKCNNYWSCGTFVSNSYWTFKGNTNTQYILCDTDSVLKPTYALVVKHLVLRCELQPNSCCFNNAHFPAKPNFSHLY